MKKNFCLAITTTNNLDEARHIANYLVENHLVACVNLVPGVESIYFWQGKVSSDSEILLLMKTTSSRSTRIKKAIRELHSYETPELIVLPIRDGMKQYLKWVEDSVKTVKAPK